MPTFTPTDESPVMQSLLLKVTNVPVFKPGELVQGKVALMTRRGLLVDFDGIATGIVAGKDVRDSLGPQEKIAVGDSISAYVIEEENDDGLVVLSLRRASQEKRWTQFHDSHVNGLILTVVASEANKGGLLLDLDGIKGFIPVSQLAPLHYPRVDGADPGQILQRLQALVGTEFKVKIISIDKENGKLILSEKAAFDDQRRSALGDLKPNQVVHGKISGIVKFGIFVAFDGLEGLVHISEIAWGHVNDPSAFGRLGQPVDVMVIGVDGDKISLSMKRLTPDPWLEVAQKYKVGTVVEGVISRVTPFGAFLELEGDINGLIHVSEVSADAVTDPGQVLKPGQTAQAKVIAIEPEEHRIGLSIKALTAPAEDDAAASGDAGDAPKKPRKKAVKKTAKDVPVEGGDGAAA